MQEDQMQEPKLMQLSIPRGWAIGDNKFHDVDPIKSNEPDSNFIDNSLLGFIEDTLWLFEWKWELDQDGNAQMVIPKTNSYSIDLGWYPGANFTGEYCARLFWNGSEWLEVDTVSSRSRYEIRDKVEQWMEEITVNYKEAHSRFL